MGKRLARSSRGDVVDFDLLEIKQSLGMTPSPIGVNTRRQFINQKEGVSATSLRNTPYLDENQVQLGSQNVAVMGVSLTDFPQISDDEQGEPNE